MSQYHVEKHPPRIEHTIPNATPNEERHIAVPGKTHIPPPPDDYQWKANQSEILDSWFLSFTGNSVTAGVGEATTPVVSVTNWCRCNNVNHSDCV